MSDDLAQELALLKQEVGRLQDESAIRKLQHTYGYFMDKGLYREAVDLFAEYGEAHVFGGVYVGKQSIARIYGRFRSNFTEGVNGPIDGVLCDVLQLQDVIHVADDRKTAKARYRCFLQGGVHTSKENKPPLPFPQWWEAGIYENDYVREDGIWKIKLLGYRLVWMADFDAGWANSPQLNMAPRALYPEDPIGPDRIDEAAPKPWPSSWVHPFHYPHPVTGAPIVPETR